MFDARVGKEGMRRPAGLRRVVSTASIYIQLTAPSNSERRSGVNEFKPAV